MGLNTHQRAFFADFIDKMKVDREEPVYHFIHLMPPHGPFVTLPDGTEADRNLPGTHDNYKIEARETLHLFLDLLDRLREEGVYDSSLIVLHADHGIGKHGLRSGEPREIKVPRAHALLAVKPIGARGPVEAIRLPDNRRRHPGHDSRRARPRSRSPRAVGLYDPGGSTTPPHLPFLFPGSEEPGSH